MNGILKTKIKLTTFKVLKVFKRLTALHTKIQTNQYSHSLIFKLLFDEMPVIEPYAGLSSPFLTSK